MRIGNFIGGYDPRAERTECIDGLAKTENAGFHFAALDIARGNVVENHVAADVARRFFRREVLAALLYHDGQLGLVIQLLRQMFRKNDWLFVADDRVYVLEENNPRNDWMG